MGIVRMNPNMNPNIVHKELSYKIVGILFEVHTKLGGIYQEKYYQRAVETCLKKQNIKYERELIVDLFLDTDKIGKYFLDFLIDGKVVLETKAVPRLLPIHFRQVSAYLKSKNLDLGIIANFRGEKLVFKRVLNGAMIRMNSVI